MKKPTVLIERAESLNTLKVSLINTLGVCCKSYLFYNFIGNGDSLAMMTNEWVNFGLFPSNGLKGVIEIKP